MSTDVTRSRPTTPTKSTGHDPNGTGGENTLTSPTPNATVHDAAENKSIKEKETVAAAETKTEKAPSDTEKGKSLTDSSPINESDLLSGKRLAVVWTAFLLYALL
jgi:hypothetical protein